MHIVDCAMNYLIVNLGHRLRGHHVAGHPRCAGHRVAADLRRTVARERHTERCAHVHADAVLRQRRIVGDRYALQDLLGVRLDWKVIF